MVANVKKKDKKHVFTLLMCCYPSIWNAQQSNLT